MNLRNILKRAYYRAFKAFAVVLLPVSAEQIKFEKVSKILIYGTMGIGNMIMFTPTIKAIRKRFPNAHITLLVAKSGCEEVVKGCSLVDDIIKTKPGRWQSFKLAVKIRRRRYDLLVSSFHGVGLKTVTTLSNIPWRIGHCSSPGWISHYDDLYNIQVRMERDEHEIDRGLNLARALGIKSDDDRPFFYVLPEDREFASIFLKQHEVYEKDMIVGVQVDSWHAQRWKQWPIDKLAIVCDLLIKRNVKVIVFGAPNHSSNLNKLLVKMKHKPIVALGKTTIKQAGALVERCNFTICNDSGLMHISAALQTPVIAIYGPTDFYRTSPSRYGNQHIIIRNDLECSPCFRLDGDAKVLACPHRLCLNSITAQDVFDVAESLIAGKQR